jgi:hypothetical protein
MMRKCEVTSLCDSERHFISLFLPVCLPTDASREKGRMRDDQRG